MAGGGRLERVGKLRAFARLRGVCLLGAYFWKISTEYDTHVLFEQPNAFALEFNSERLRLNTIGSGPQSTCSGGI